MLMKSVVRGIYVTECRLCTSVPVHARYCVFALSGDVISVRGRRRICVEPREALGENQSQRIVLEGRIRIRQSPGVGLDERT